MNIDGIMDCMAWGIHDIDKKSAYAMKSRLRHCYRARKTFQALFKLLLLSRGELDLDKSSDKNWMGPETFGLLAGLAVGVMVFRGG